MDDNEDPTNAPDVDLDRSLDRRQRWPYLIFGVIALCVIVAIARFFFLQ